MGRRCRLRGGRWGVAEARGKQIIAAAEQYARLGRQFSIRGLHEKVKYLAIGQHEMMENPVTKVPGVAANDRVAIEDGGKFRMLPRREPFCSHGHAKIHITVNVRDSTGDVSPNPDRDNFIPASNNGRHVMKRLYLRQVRKIVEAKLRHQTLLVHEAIQRETSVFASKGIPKPQRGGPMSAQGEATRAPANVAQPWVTSH